MPSLDPRAPLVGIATPGRFGNRDGAPGIVIAERTDLALASVIARRGRSETLAAAVHAGYGIALPAGPRRAAGGNVAFAGIGSDQWMASAQGADAADFVATLKSRLTSLAAVSDQSDTRVVLRLHGPRVREILTKGVPIDLHRRAFKPGDVASTLVAYMGVQIEQHDDAPTYQLMAFRSLAGSLWSWLTASAAEFGYEVVRPG